jgi:hypothetical protein
VGHVIGVPQNVVCAHGAINEEVLKTTSVEVNNLHRKLENLVQFLPMVLAYLLIPEAYLLIPE